METRTIITVFCMLSLVFVLTASITNERYCEVKDEYGFIHVGKCHEVLRYAQ